MRGTPSPRRPPNDEWEGTWLSGRRGWHGQWQGRWHDSDGPRRPCRRCPLAQPPRPHLASTRRPRPQRRRQPERWKRGTRAPSEQRRAIRCAWQVATPSAPAATNLKKAPQQSAHGRGRGRRADSDERREPETESRKRDYEAGRRIISTRRWAAPQLPRAFKSWVTVSTSRSEIEHTDCGLWPPCQ